MRNLICYCLFLSLLIISCNNPPKPGPDQGGPVIGQPAVVGAVLTQVPYTVSLSNPVELATDSVQSYVIAEWDGYWLIVGGRINGFHGTGGSGSTFPVRYANEEFILYQPSSQRRWSAPLPAAYKDQLSSTNMPYYQDDATLWVAGGYGCVSANPGAPCNYRTYPNLTAINIPMVISSILNGGDPSPFIATLEDPRFAVTGGMIRKINDNYYLVMGQNYDTIYVNGITGQYTEEIRRYNATFVGQTITVTNYQAIQNAEFHRRDLNVLEAVRTDRSVGINVFAGVFKPNAQFGTAWTNPVLIDEDASGATTYKIDTFTQQFNAYDCGHILMFDTGTNTMYTTLLGGITNAGLDASGKVVPPNGFLPFSKYISTIAQYSDGSTKEYPQASPLLPGFIGASGDLVLNGALPKMSGTTTVLDYAQLPAGDNLIGWYYGGINSTAEQTNAVSNPSFASATIYEVHLMK